MQGYSFVGILQGFGFRLEISVKWFCKRTKIGSETENQKLQKIIVSGISTKMKIKKDENKV